MATNTQTVNTLLRRVTDTYGLNLIWVFSFTTELSSRNRVCSSLMAAQPRATHLRMSHKSTVET